MSQLKTDIVRETCTFLKLERKVNITIEGHLLRQAVIEKTYRELESLCSDPKTDINQRDMNGLTALHWAVEMHDEQSIELIGNHPDVNINAEDGSGLTPLHWAVEKNNTYAIQFLCSKYGISVNARNTAGFSPLHLAVKKANNDALRFLCKQENVVINSRTNQGFTPFHVSVTSSNKEAISILFDHSADALNDITDRKTTALSIAAFACNQEICKVIVYLKPALALDMDNSEQAAIRRVRAMRNPCHNTQLFGMGGLEIINFLVKNTPTVEYHDADNIYRASAINLMIENMPDLVEDILDRSILEVQVLTLSEDLKNSQLYEDRIIFDFFVVEPYHHNKTCKRRQFGCTEEVCICNSTFEQIGKDYDGEIYCYYNNPLEVMVKFNQFRLLTHPVVEALIKRKWESFARLYFYLATFLTYMFFMSMLLTYELTQIRPFANQTHRCSNSTTTIDCFTVKSKMCIVSGYTVLILSICRLFLEVMELFQGALTEYNYLDGRNLKSLIVKPVIRYFGEASNVMELLLYSTAALFSWNVTKNDILSPFQWQIGSLCVFMAFMNLLSIIRIFGVVGLYVTMFLQILWTFISKIGLLLVIFVCLFLIVFEMLVSKSPIFSESLSFAAFYKILSMGVSGVDYEDYEIEDVALHYPVALFFALLMFVIFVQILFLNLATSLAIEDVGQIRSHSDAKKNAVKIKQIYHSEKVLLQVQKILLFLQRPFCRRAKESNLLGVLKRFYSRPSDNFYWKKKIKERSILKSDRDIDLLKMLEDLKSSIAEDLLLVKEELSLRRNIQT